MAVQWAWQFGVSAEVVSGRGRKALLHPTIFCFTVRFVVRIDRQATVWWNRCFAESEVTWRHFRRQCCFNFTNSDGSFLPICCFLSVLLFAVLILCFYFILCCFFYYFLLFSALLSCVFFVLLCSLFSLLFFSVRLLRFSFSFFFYFLLSCFALFRFCFLLLLSLLLFSSFLVCFVFSSFSPLFRTLCEIMGSRLILVHPVETIFAGITPWHLTMFDEPLHVNELLWVAVCQSYDWSAMCGIFMSVSKRNVTESDVSKLPVPSRDWIRFRVKISVKIVVGMHSDQKALFSSA